MTEEERMERASKAAVLLANPMLTDGFDLVRKSIVEKWEQSPIRDKEGQHELKLMLKLLSDVRAALEQAVNDGKVIAFEKKRRFFKF